jgi:hypothetical protein
MTDVGNGVWAANLWSFKARFGLRSTTRSDRTALNSGEGIMRLMPSPTSRDLERGTRPAFSAG